MNQINDRAGAARTENESVVTVMPPAVDVPPALRWGETASGSVTAIHGGWVAKGIVSPQASLVVYSYDEPSRLIERPTGAGTTVQFHLPWRGPDLIATELGSSRAMLISQFEIQSVEDGVFHPGEDLLRRVLSLAGVEWVQGVWLEVFDRPTVAAGLLRCLSRVAPSGNHRLEAMAIAGLWHRSSAVRESAVACVEEWKTSRLIETLRRHEEPSAWLREYIGQVLSDL